MGIHNPYGSGTSATAKRHRTVIMTLNVDSLVGNKETLEMYVNDREIHIMVIVESNVTESKLPLVKLNHYSIASKSCREDNLTKGGGGEGF